MHKVSQPRTNIPSIGRPDPNASQGFDAVRSALQETQQKLGGSAVTVARPLGAPNKGPSSGHSR